MRRFKESCFEEKSEVEKRKHKRYDYKPDRRPTLNCRDVQYKVLNISEGGLKIEIQSDPANPSDLYFLNGDLCFSSGELLPISGTQVWIIGNEIGIKLDEPISAKIIESEFGNFQDAEQESS